MTPRDPSLTSATVWPMPGTVAWATNGTGRAGASDATVVVLGYDPSIMAAATSTYVGGVTTDCVVPTTVGATSTVGSPVRPAIDSGITAITGCFVTFEGTP